MTTPSASSTSAASWRIDPQSSVIGPCAGRPCDRKLVRPPRREQGPGSAPDLDAGLTLDESDRLHVVGLLPKDSPGVAEQFAHQMEHRRGDAGLIQQTQGNPDILLQEREPERLRPSPAQHP